MQRLTRTARRAAPSDRRPDDGAVSVIVALLLVVLIGFVGLGVDVTAAYAKTQEAQNGADAAALGLAQACATTELTCPGPGDHALAHDLSTANVRHQVDTVTTTLEYPPAGNQVRATVSGESDNAFVRIFGIDSFTVSEQAAAAWGAPTGGISAMPLTFSMCQFLEQGGASGVPATLLFTKTSETTCVLPSSGNTLPAGFAYIGEGDCGAQVNVDGWVPSQPGNNPKGCSDAEMASLVGEVVLLPVYDACVSQSNAPGCTEDASAVGFERGYRIHAFAAFELHGYNLGGSFKAGSPVPCNGSARCVRGAFVEWVSIEDSWEYGDAPDLGASVVTLVN